MSKTLKIINEQLKNSMYMSGKDMPLDTTRKKGVVYRCGHFDEARRAGDFDLYQLADHKWGVTPLNQTGNYAFIVPKSLLKANSNIVSNDAIKSGEYYLACIANESLVKYGHNSDCSPLPDNIIGVVKLNITDAASIAQIAGYSDEASLCTGIANQGVLDFTATSLADYFIFGVTNANAQELGLDATVSSALVDEEKGIPASWNNMDGAMMDGIFSKNSAPGDLRGYYQIYTAEQLKAYGLNHPNVNPIEDDALVVWDGYMWRSLTGGSVESTSQAASTLTHDAKLVRSEDFNNNTWQQNQLYQAGDNINIDGLCKPYSYNNRNCDTRTGALQWSFEYNKGSLILKIPKREAAGIFLTTTPENIVVELSSQDGVVYTDKLPSPIICAVYMAYTTNADMVTKFGGTWSSSYCYFVSSSTDAPQNILDTSAESDYGIFSYYLACTNSDCFAMSIYPAASHTCGFRSATNSIHRLTVGDYFYYDGYQLCKLYPSEDDLVRAGSDKYSNVRFTNMVNGDYSEYPGSYATNYGHSVIAYPVTNRIRYNLYDKPGTMKVVTSAGGPVSTACYKMDNWATTELTNMMALYPIDAYTFVMIYPKSGDNIFQPTCDEFLVALYIDGYDTLLSYYGNEGVSMSDIQKMAIAFSASWSNKLIALLPFRKCSWEVASQAGVEMADNAQDGLNYAIVDVNNPLMYLSHNNVVGFIANCSTKFTPSPLHALFYDGPGQLDTWNGWNDDSEIVENTDSSGNKTYTMDVLPNAKQGDYVMWDGYRYVKMNDSGLNSASLTKVISTTGCIALQSDIVSVLAAADANSQYQAIPVFKFDDFDADAIKGVAVMMSVDDNDNGYASKEANLRVLIPGGDFVQIHHWPSSKDCNTGMQLSEDGTIYMYNDPRGTNMVSDYLLMPIPAEGATIKSSDVTLNYANYTLSAAVPGTKTNCLYQNITPGWYYFNNSNNKSAVIRFSSYVAGTVKVYIGIVNNYSSSITFTLSFTGTDGKSQTKEITVASKSTGLVCCDCPVTSQVPETFSGSGIPITSDVIKITASNYTSYNNVESGIYINSIHIGATITAASGVKRNPQDTGIIYYNYREASKAANYEVEWGGVAIGSSSGYSYTTKFNQLTSNKSEFIGPSGKIIVN